MLAYGFLCPKITDGETTRRCLSPPNRTVSVWLKSVAARWVMAKPQIPRMMSDETSMRNSQELPLLSGPTPIIKMALQSGIEPAIS